MNIKTGDRVVRNETGEAGVIDAVFEATETNPARGSFRGDVRGKQGLVGLGEFRLEEPPVRDDAPAIQALIDAAAQPEAARPKPPRAKKKPAAKKAAKGTAAKKAPKKKRP